MSREHVLRSLLRLDRPSDVAAHHREPALGLGIDVDGVGRCEFPLTTDRITALIEHARPSPFGYHDQTLHDPSVRRSWEIPAANVHLDARWSRRFDRGLRAVLERLGLPLDGHVTPVLHKLLIYEPGGFFARHRDSQTHPSTAATLVVVLPAPHRGGDLRITHAGAELTVATATDARANYLAFVGFYADALHEIVPVEAGHRVALTYALEVEAQPLPEARGGAADLELRLREFFADDGEGGGAEWLIYLLDHQYTEQSIDWSRLKQADRARVAALLAAAEPLGLDAFLALADAHESREYVGDDADDADTDADTDAATPTLADTPRERCLPSPSPDRNDDPGDPRTLWAVEPDPAAHAGDLVDLEITLTSWIDRAGRPCRGTDTPADGRCVLLTSDLDERTAYQTATEPWTGNEGGTAEKWYHLAALVLIPRGSDLHAEVSEVAEVEPG